MFLKNQALIFPNFTINQKETMMRKLLFHKFDFN